MFAEVRMQMLCYIQHECEQRRHINQSSDSFNKETAEQASEMTGGADQRVIAVVILCELFKRVEMSLEDCPLSAVRIFSFSIFTAALHFWRQSSASAIPRYAML
jgi:hypothetical protein